MTHTFASHPRPWLPFANLAVAVAAGALSVTALVVASDDAGPAAPRAVATDRAQLAPQAVATKGPTAPVVFYGCDRRIGANRC